MKVSDLERSAFTLHRLAFAAWRSAFTVWRSAFTASAFAQRNRPAYRQVVALLRPLHYAGKRMKRKPKRPATNAERRTLDDER
jgi:hypothetical protein